jgi:glycosyltransferase involved in cell wall biosynthesis
MRIAYFIQSYFPMVSGSALMVRRLAEGMAARGHSGLVLAASDRGEPYTEDTNGLRISRLRSYPNPFRVGQRFVPWPGAALRAELRRFRPDLVHLHDFSPAAVDCVGAGRAVRVPLVLTLHQLPWFITTYLPRLPGLPRIVEPMLWRYLRWLAQPCAALITPSRMMSEVASAHLQRPVTPITNGVALERFSPEPASPDERVVLCQRYGLDLDLPVILYVGRLDADKRVDWVIRAAARAMQGTPAQLLIAGDGKQRAELERLSETLGIRARCRFPGYVSVDGELPGLYRLASVFVTASVVEIQSSVVLEACASGVPVVAARASSMAEFVEEGVSGYLAPPDDVAALADRVTRGLSQTAGQRRAMQRAALAVAQQHSIAAALDGHERLYRRYLSEFSSHGDASCSKSPS